MVSVKNIAAIIVATGLCVSGVANASGASEYANKFVAGVNCTLTKPKQVCSESGYLNKCARLPCATDKNCDGMACNYLKVTAYTKLAKPQEYKAVSADLKKMQRAACRKYPKACNALKRKITELNK